MEQNSDDVKKIRDLLSRLFYNRPFDPGASVPDPLNILANDLWGRPYNPSTDPPPRDLLATFLYGRRYDPVTMQDPIDLLEVMLNTPMRNYIPNMDYVTNRLIGMPELPVKSAPRPSRLMASPIEIFREVFERFKATRTLDKELLMKAREKLLMSKKNEEHLKKGGKTV
ncbi:MAG: hypothetical protein ACP6IU_04920 [Candidatus Asgardarchaeia archaeon]